MDADYLIVGSGAVGMAFADTLLTETDATLVIVDRYPKPGGHWNFAYPFVTLHQPSAFYGVSSRELCSGRKDDAGLNKGLSELASGVEVLAYFDDVMRHRFLPSGRVRYFPMCEYTGDGTFRSVLSGDRFQLSVRKKTVDATYLNTSVPSTHTPGFSVAPDVRLMPLNDLPRVASPPANYVVVGGGKTGIDACLWLLEHGVDPQQIQWIVPRDAWLLDRGNTQPADEFFERSIGTQAAQFEAAAGAKSIPDLFDRLEAVGALVRIDTSVQPQMFHGATVSQLELEELRRIRNVIRKGRVQSIEANRIVLDGGSIAADTRNLYVDCSARAISNLRMKPVFAGQTITPQTVRPYQPVFSASFIAYVEAHYADEQQKNSLCGVVPLPNHDTDWIRMTIAMMRNQHHWSQDDKLRNWVLENRLDGFGLLIRQASQSDSTRQTIIRRLRDYAMPAMGNLQKLAAAIN